MISITFDINPDGLRSVTDEHLHALWHIAQANPAPQGDRTASALVSSITDEIVRRWLKTTPAEQFNHTPAAHHWSTLVQHGNWRGPDGAWLPYDVAGTPTQGAELQTTASASTAARHGGAA